MVDVDAFFGFHGLMQTIAPATSRHFTAGLLIYDDDLVFFDHVFIVFFVETIGAKKLGDVVNSLALNVQFTL